VVYILAVLRRVITAVAGVFMVLLGAETAQLQTPNRGGPARTLTAAEVRAVVTGAANALADTTMAVAVVDRKGAILAVYRRPGAAATTPDVAVSLARTTAYFSNDQAPLSSRTVRTISGIHFPPGIPNTPNAALYGVENINRGCDLDPSGEPFGIPRPRSIAGTVGVPLRACNPSDTSGCSIGITTGKTSLLDANNGSEAAVNPGGLPLYRDGKLIGGVGVAGVSSDRAEFAALLATQVLTAGITTAIAFPSLLPVPGAIYIDGIRLPFYGQCSTFISCIQAAAQARPSGSSAGTLGAGSFIIDTFTAGGNAPEGYLCCRGTNGQTPRGSLAGDGLTTADVAKIVTQAIEATETMRAQVRLPYGQTPTFVISVTDEGGRILALYRMEDALFDAVDVVPSKARNAYYFSTPEGYQVLRGYVNSNPYDRYTWTPEPPGGAWALTSRTIGFGGQPLFPPGIDREKKPTPGPWFDLFQYDTANPCTEGPGPSRGGNRAFRFQNGITWFPGSTPLYKNGKLVGGLGVSGDGIEQNDYVTYKGAEGFEAPLNIRVDNSVIRTGAGTTVPLPYLKFPRNPTDR
jgi:uncharacterized protein GlcG (DUF336 family)